MINTLRCRQVLKRAGKPTQRLYVGHKTKSPAGRQAELSGAGNGACLQTHKARERRVDATQLNVDGIEIEANGK